MVRPVINGPSLLETMMPTASSDVTDSLSLSLMATVQRSVRTTTGAEAETGQVPGRRRWRIGGLRRSVVDGRGVVAPSVGVAVVSDGGDQVGMVDTVVWVVVGDVVDDTDADVVGGVSSSVPHEGTQTTATARTVTSTAARRCRRCG